MNNIDSIDPNDIVNAINKIFEESKEIYEDAPLEPNIKVEIIKERCKSENCPFEHTVVNITADYILGEEILDICLYLRKNELPFCYMDNSFKIVLN